MITIYEMFMENNLEDIFVAKKFTCGHTNGYSEYLFFEDDETEDYKFKDYIYETYKDITVDKYDEYKILGTTLFLYIYKDTVCKTCKAKDKTVYCDEQPKPVGFEKVTKYHGLAAYYSDGTYKETINNFEKLNNHPEWQICCSTDTIGDIGVVVEGDVLLASNLDLNTAVNNGRRYYIKTDRKQEHIIYDAKDLKKNEYNMNNELVVQNTRIVAIWLTDTASDDSVQAAFDLSDKYNLEVIDVEQDF